MRLSSILSLSLIFSIILSPLSVEGKGSGGGSRGPSSSSSRSANSNRSPVIPSSSRKPPSSSQPPSSTTPTKSSSSINSTKPSSSVFTRGPSSATIKVAETKARNLNSSTRPLSQSELATSVKSIKPADIGVSPIDTSRLSTMQKQHEELQRIPFSQRNTSNPIYVQQQTAYERERIIFIQSHPTTYIPIYGTTTYGPYDGGNIRYVQPANDASGVENFFKGLLTFLLWMCAIGLGSFTLYKLIVWAIKRKEEAKAEIDQEQKDQERF
jgi:hypothetical protein